MSNNNVTNKFVLIENGLTLLAIAALLIAMMHYGYSCSCMGCDIVDSRTVITK